MTLLQKRAEWKFSPIEPLCVSLHNHKTETYCCSEFGALPNTLAAIFHDQKRKHHRNKEKNRKKIWRKKIEKRKRQNYALKLQVNNFVDFLSKISTSLRPLIGKRWSMNHQVLDFFEQKCVWKVRKISQKREKWAFLASIWSTGRCKSWTRWEFRSGFVTREVIRNFFIFFENLQKKI